MQKPEYECIPRWLFETEEQEAKGKLDGKNPNANSGVEFKPLHLVVDNDIC